jgi:hypothetical protein
MYWQDQSSETRAVLLNFLHLVKTCIDVMPDKSGCFFDIISEAYVFNTNIPYPNMNGIVSFESELAKIKQNIAASRKRIGETSMPITFFWPHAQTVDKATDELLHAEGFESLGQYTCATCKPENILHKELPLSENVEIVQVTTDSEFDAFMQITQRVFSVPDEGIAPMRNLYQAYTFTDMVKLYMAKVDSEPASILLAFQDGGTLGLYNGATLANYQKQGLTAALTKHAVGELKEVCHQVVAQLMAAKQAEGLCKLFRAEEISTFEPYCHGFNTSNLSV